MVQLRSEERASEAEWEVWYQDTFDRECPRQVEVAGRGLVEGLIQLWARHLFETVQADGQRGFSRFNLWWKQERRSVVVVGEWEGEVTFNPVEKHPEGMKARYTESIDWILDGRFIRCQSTLTLPAGTMDFMWLITYDSKEGYLLDFRRRNEFGYNMESQEAYTVVLGWKMLRYVTLRAEYAHVDIELVDGVPSPLRNKADDADSFAIEVGVHF